MSVCSRSRDTIAGVTRDEALAWENTVVLAVVQAMLGLVSPALLGVAVEIDGETVTVHFAVPGLNEELTADIEDIVGDVEGLLWPLTPEVRSRVHVGDTNDGWDGSQHRSVLLAKEHGV
jgi:hypothetical protein